MGMVNGTSLEQFLSFISPQQFVYSYALLAQASLYGGMIFIVVAGLFLILLYGLRLPNGQATHRSLSRLLLTLIIVVFTIQTVFFFLSNFGYIAYSGMEVPFLAFNTNITFLNFFWMGLALSVLRNYRIADILLEYQEKSIDEL